MSEKIQPSGPAFPEEDIKEVLLQEYSGAGVYIFSRGRIVISLYATSKSAFENVRVVQYREPQVLEEPEQPDED